MLTLAHNRLSPARRMGVIKLALTLALAASALIAAAGAAAYYMEIEGIQGDVTDRGHANSIQVFALKYDFGQSAPGARPEAGEFVVIKRVDKSSPALLMKAVSGQEVGSVRVQVCNPPEVTAARAPQGPLFQPGDCSMQVTLNGVTVTRLAAYSTESGMVEEVGFRYRTIRLDYQNAANGTSSSAGWDFAQNRPQ